MSEIKVSVQKLKVTELKSHEENPRIIKDKKYKELRKSIQDFGEMLDIREIVIDENNVVLGGNMRLKVLQELNIAEVSVKKVLGLSEQQKREFVIKDNVNFGEWNWDDLANEWNAEQLNEWGLDVPFSDEEVKEMTLPDNMQTKNVFATELDDESNYVVLKFDKDIDWLQAKTLFGIKTETARRANGKEWSKGIGRVLNGVEVINKIKNES